MHMHMCHCVHEVYSFEPPGFYLVGRGGTGGSSPFPHKLNLEIIGYHDMSEAYILCMYTFVQQLLELLHSCRKPSCHIHNDNNNNNKSYR